VSQPTEKMVTEIWAYVVTDHLGIEGVLRRSTPIGTQPMIADSRERLQPFLEEAVAVALELKLKLGIARFVRDERTE
jgi:hypothetical protein